MKTKIILSGLLLATCLFSCKEKNAEASKPNIILIYIDDLGYGDVGYNGAVGVKTPNVDDLANNGLQFTDGHCTASTCTPSRFSLLTGSYAFRNNAAILPGDAPLLIRNTTTMPAMLQKAGYKTAVIGKWHLGLGDGVINWNGDIRPGPNEIGFDYSFLVPATLDRVPCVYVENHNVVNLDPKDPIKVSYKEKIGDLPTGLEDPELLKFKADTQHSNTIINGIGRIGFMSGGKSALWKDEDIAKVLISKVNNFITENKNAPFFLYFSFTDIHVPRAPNAIFDKSSTMGARGNDIAQMDWSVGQLMTTLKKLNIAGNTLIIFSSDNGPVLNDGYDDKAEEMVGRHMPAGPYKGGKYSSYEAGTRVPTIAYWPGTIMPGKSDAMVNQVDLYASLAKLTGQQLAAKDAPDSFEQLDAWLGKIKTGRSSMIEEAFTLSLRNNDWKYIAPTTNKGPAWLKNKKVATGLSTEGQLYNLKTDVKEEHNVIAQNKAIADKMDAELKEIKAKGRSRQ